MKYLFLCECYLVGESGEPPDVADADTEADTGKYEFPFAAPILALLLPTLSLQVCTPHTVYMVSIQ